MKISQLNRQSSIGIFRSRLATFPAIFPTVHLRLIRRILYTGLVRYVRCHRMLEPMQINTRRSLAQLNISRSGRTELIEDSLPGCKMSTT